MMTIVQKKKDSLVAHWECFYTQQVRPFPYSTNSFWPIILVSILGLLSFSISGQTAQGVILDKQTNEPIPFVNVGVANTSIGTVSDERGIYKIQLKDNVLKDSLTFSCIGYKNYRVPVGQFLSSNKKDTIFLSPQIYPLNELVVLPSRSKTKFLGNKALNGIVTFYFGSNDLDSNDLGHEIGIQIKLRQNAMLQSIHLSILKSSFDSILYRINIYQKIDNDYKNILKEPIFLRVAKQKAKEYLTLDVHDKGIILQGDCIIALQHIKYLGDGEFWLGSEMLSRFSTYGRESSLSAWEKIPFGIGIGATVLMDKK